MSASPEDLASLLAKMEVKRRRVYLRDEGALRGDAEITSPEAKPRSPDAHG